MFKIKYSLILPLFCLLLVLFLTPTQGVEQAPGGKVKEPEIKKILIGLKELKLLAFSNGNLVFKFPVAVGADTGPSPTGEFKVVNRLKNPWYTPGDEPAKAPGPNNPLGTRWIGISKPHYGIHGTKNPASIGTRSSEGCIRLYNRDVEKLYQHVNRGTRVIIKQKLENGLTKMAAKHPGKSSREDES